MPFMLGDGTEQRKKSEPLDRFKKAQESVYKQALEEIKKGCKSGHWIWFIFPQMKGLGMSYNANYYGISDLEEAKAYLMDPILGSRLVEISQTLLDLQNVTMWDVFGGVDEMKLRSSMTLFSMVSEDSVFEDVLNRYFNGEKDELTLTLVNRQEIHNSL